MKKESRVARSVRRSEKNPETYNVRNLKADKKFTRWFNGLLITRIETGWMLHSSGKGLIHKGRKP